MRLSQKALNHEEHEGHEGKRTALLCVLRVLRGSLLFRAFCDALYISLFILLLPMLGTLEHSGLRERAETLISSVKNA